LIRNIYSSAGKVIIVEDFGNRERHTLLLRQGGAEAM
jgi:hypothetical protein